MFKLSARSLGRLIGVHPALTKIVHRAIEITHVDFSVVEGLRSLKTQRRYFELGKSKTMNSRHLTGHAVDLAPWINGTIEWEDPAGYQSVAIAMKTAAHSYGIPLEWGGDWKWKDCPHFQLSWSAYP